MKLLIRNLARDTTEADLQDLFEGYGAVQSCNLVLDKVTGKSKGFAFVEMPKLGAAKAAMKNLNGKHVDGNVIRVKKAVTKEKEPLSSDKESSALDKESSTPGNEPSASDKESSTPEKKSSTPEKKPSVSPYRRN